MVHAQSKCSLYANVQLLTSKLLSHDSLTKQHTYMKRVHAVIHPS